MGKGAREGMKNERKRAGMEGENGKTECWQGKRGSGWREKG